MPPCVERRNAASKTLIAIFRRKMPGIPDRPLDVTALLLAWRGGDDSALGRIVPLVHEELRKIARRCLRGENAAHSLQATALVNEAYIRLVDIRLVDWQNRVHFLAMSARLMRRVLVDAGRARGADKRGGHAVRVSLSEALGRPDELGHDVVALHDALEQLEQVDARKGRLVELRFFAGLSVEEAAVVLEVSPQTAARDWTFAKAWLRRELDRT
jgi:RNA polymerase sigma factor (TIGR02999 family)